MVTIRLTNKQAEKLSDILCEHQDEGPMGEGWQSPELEEINNIVSRTIEAKILSRKVIQVMYTDKHNVDKAGAVLCDDGTAWYKDHRYQPPKWKPFELPILLPKE